MIILLDTFHVPMHCTGNSGCFPRGKRASTVRRALPNCFWFFSCTLYFRVSIPPAAKPTPFQQMDIGSLTCAKMWVRAVDTKGGQAQHVCTRVDSEGHKKLSLTLHRQGIEPRVFGFEFRRTKPLSYAPPPLPRSPPCLQLIALHQRPG